MGKHRFWSYKVSKLEEVSNFDALTCLVSSLWFSCGLAVSMGEAANPFLFKGAKAGCHVVLRGRRGTLWHSNLFDNASKVVFVWQAQHSTLHTLHSTLYTPHSSLHPLHFTLQALHSTLYTPHSTLYTLHSTLCTLHFTLHTPHSTL